MVDENGRVINVGDKAPGGTIIQLTTMGGKDAVMVQLDALNVPGGYVVLSEAIPTCSPADVPDNGWWTCFPKACIP